MIYMKQNYVEIVREVNFKTNSFRNQASLHQESKYLELRNIPLSYHSEVRSENWWHHAVNKRSNLNVLSHSIASMQRLSFYIFLLYSGCVPIYIKRKLVGRWDTFPHRFSYLYLESNHHDRVDDTLLSRAACVCSLGWQATGYMLKVLTFWAKRAVVYIFHVFVNMLDITKTGLPSLVVCWWKVLHLGHLNEVSMIIAYLTY